MAISNYLMSRLAAVENARQLSLQTEQARAAREAAGQRATTQYLQQLLGAGTQLATSGYGISKDLEAAQAAKDLEDMDLQAKIQAARDAELTQGGGQVDPVTGQVVPGVESGSDGEEGPPIDTSPEYNPAAELSGKMTPAVPVAAVPTDAIVPVATSAIQGLFPDQPKDPSMAGGITRRDAAVSATDFKPATPIIPSAKTLPADATRRPGTGTTAVSPLMPTAATVTEADLAGQKTGSAPRAEDSLVTKKIEPASITPLVSGAKSGVIANPPIPGFHGLTLGDITSSIPQQAPATPAVASTVTPAVASTIPTPAEFKQTTGIDVAKPAVAAAVIKAADKVGYKPLTFEKAASPQEEAKKIVDQVWKKQPPGNPLTAFFNHGKNTGQMDQARRMAELKVELTIRNTRKELQAAHEASYLSKLDVQTKEAQIDFIRARSVLATANADQTIRLETKLPPGDRKDLDNAYMASDHLNKLKNTTTKLVETTGNIPVGPIREYQKALAAAAGIDIGTSATTNVGAQISAQLGIGAGGGVGMSTTKGGKRIDADAYRKAFEAMDRLNLSPEEQQFVNEYHQAIQIIGKAREGGRMTDADARNYEKMLFANSSPQAFVNSLNDLGSTQSGIYNRTYGIISRNFDLGDVYPGTMEWQPLVLGGPIGETQLNPQARNLAIPGAPADLAGSILNSMDLTSLKNLLNNPSTSSTAKPIIEAEIAKKSAAAKKPRQTSPRTQPAADPFK